MELGEAFCHQNPWARPGGFALLSVRDTGCGMDGETRQRIFEPFFTTKSEGGGTGLGLSTVYGIVRQHDGLIHVSSEVGQRATFTIYLHLTTSPNTAVPVDELTRAVGGTEVILLAEDDDRVRAVTARFLEDAGYTVLQATDGVHTDFVLDQGLELIQKPYTRDDLLHRVHHALDS